MNNVISSRQAIAAAGLFLNVAPVTMTENGDFCAPTKNRLGVFNVNDQPVSLGISHTSVAAYRVTGILIYDGYGVRVHPDGTLSTGDELQFEDWAFAEIYL